MLEEENISLKIEISELKERFGLNLSNSSISSSKELYKMRENSQKFSKRIVRK